MMKRELFRYGISGTIAVITDLITYFGLLFFINPYLSKFISFIAGTLVAYLLNKFWTFGKKQRSIKELLSFLLLYTSTLIANVVANEVVLALTGDLFIAGFLVATGISTVLNFIGQKWWVFRSEEAINHHSMLQ